MNYIKGISLLLSILFLVNASAFADNVKIYSLSNVIFNDNGIAYDKIDNTPVNGILKTYYMSGKVKFETPLKNGKRNGTSKAYSEFGKILGETSYKEGKENGVEKQYYESGKIKLEIPYKDDKKHGVERYYKSGRINQKTTYKNGKAVSGFIYTEDGKKRKMTNEDLYNINK